MFTKNRISEYNILVVNQTLKDNLLNSNDNNIRVINSFEKGLSKSRNLAIQNAIGEICLLADDDTVFEPDFGEIILGAYNENQQADVITFKTLTTENAPFYSNYPKNTRILGNFSRKVLSIEISFNLNTLRKNKVNFNENFGLGALFQDGENQIFFRDLFKKKLNLVFAPKFIVKHEGITSSDSIASDRFMYARSALNYELNGVIGYLYIFKLTFALLKRNLIGFNEILPKITCGLKGIKDYKKIV